MLESFHEQLKRDGTLTLSVRVHPFARRTQVKDILDDGSIKIDLIAPPEDGKANEELIEFLTAEFGLPKTNIEILSGHTSRQKIVRLQAK